MQPTDHGPCGPWSVRTMVRASFSNVTHRIWTEAKSTFKLVSNTLCPQLLGWTVFVNSQFGKWHSQVNHFAPIQHIWEVRAPLLGDSLLKLHWFQFSVVLENPRPPDPTTQPVRDDEKLERDKPPKSSENSPPSEKFLKVLEPGKI